MHSREEKKRTEWLSSPSFSSANFFGGQHWNDTFGDPRFRICAEYRNTCKMRLGTTSEITSRGTESVQLRDAPRKPVTCEQNIIRDSIVRDDCMTQDICTRRTRVWVSIWVNVVNFGYRVARYLELGRKYRCKCSALQHTLHKENGVLWNHEYDNDVVTCSSPPLSTECNIVSHFSKVDTHVFRYILAITGWLKVCSYGASVTNCQIFDVWLVEIIARAETSRPIRDLKICTGTSLQLVSLWKIFSWCCVILLTSQLFRIREATNPF